MLGNELDSDVRAVISALLLGLVLGAGVTGLLWYLS